MTARLSVGNARVDVTVIDYQFPDLTHNGGRIEDDYDANWLSMVVTATDGRRRWRVAAQNCLLNWELIELVHWMERVADGKRPRWPFSCIEMVPEFGLSSDGAWLSIYLGPTSTSPHDLRMPVNADAIRRFAEELKSEIAPFKLRTLELNGEAHQVALRFNALDGLPVAAMSVRLPSDISAAKLSDQDAGRRLANFDRRAMLAVHELAGATFGGWHRLLSYEPRDPSAPRFTGRFRPVPRFTPTAEGIEVDYPAGSPDLVAVPSEMRAIFPSPIDAVGSARRLIQEGSRADVRLQVGLHYGVIVREPDDDIGGAVAVASKVGELCEPGCILMSEAACELAGEYGGLAFVERGSVVMVGATEPLQLYEVR